MPRLVPTPDGTHSRRRTPPQLLITSRAHAGTHSRRQSCKSQWDLSPRAFAAGAGTCSEHAGEAKPQAPHRPEPLKPLAASPSWLPPRSPRSQRRYHPAALSLGTKMGSDSPGQLPPAPLKPKPVSRPDAPDGWAQVLLNLIMH